MGDADIRGLLQRASSQHGPTIAEAEQGLEYVKQQDFAYFLSCMAAELDNENNEPQVRQMAGFILKINLYSKDPDINQQHQENYKQLPDDTRASIKGHLVQALRTDLRDAGAVAAQVLGKIAAIELPFDAWPELVPGLLSNMGSESATHKCASVDTLGYICESVPAHVLQPCVNDILTAVVAGMQKEEQSMDVRLSATKALNNALAFIQAPFEEQEERDYLMTVVCEAATQGNERVKKEAMQCLVKIVQTFYDKMQPYMQALFDLTLNSIATDPDEVARQAIEFWNTIAEEEEYLDDQAERARANNEQPEAVSVGYIRFALNHLAPLILETMTKQEDDQDEDTWNLAMAAGTCLEQIALTIHDDVAGYVFQFVRDNVDNDNWRYREAAIFAFGSVLEGVSDGACAELVATGIPRFVELMKDDVPLVSETATWTIGRICKFKADCIDEDHISPLVDCLLVGLGHTPRVANNCAWAFSNLSRHYGGEDLDTYKLSDYYGKIIETLLVDVCERGDADEAKLRSGAYTAVNNLIETAPRDCDADVFSAFNVLVERLELSLNMEPDSGVTETQGLICASLQVITQKTGEDIVHFADRLMTVYLGILASKAATVMEECLLAIGALASAIGNKFIDYMDHFFAFLKIGLTNYQEYQVCYISVGVVSDLCRALGDAFDHWSADIVAILLEDLKNPSLQRDVKPQILSCFGDIALALGGNYVKYLNLTMQVLSEASELEVDRGSDELLDYLNELRENILDAYSGIIQGLAGANQTGSITQAYVDQIMALCERVYQDNDRSEAVTKNAVAAIGDIGHALGTHVAVYMQRDWIMPLVRQCRQCVDEEDALEIAQFTMRTLREIQGQAPSWGS